jgi:hypothetical protein
MTALVRTLIATHLAVFAAGVYVGKSIDADELELYRSAHESSLSRWLRKAQTLGIAVALVGSVAMAVRVARTAGGRS